MSHLFVDANVLLDFLMYREPFALTAARLFQQAENGKLHQYCSSLTFSQAHYVLRKTVGSTKATELLLEMAELVTILAVDSTVVHQALTLGFADFEDGLQYCAARTVSAIEAIVTRDPKGFAGGTLPVPTPPEALERLW